MELIAKSWQLIAEKSQWLWEHPEVTWSGTGLTALAVLYALITKLFAPRFRRSPDPPANNTCTNSGPGTQNIAQGTGAIGQQNNDNSIRVSNTGSGAVAQGELRGSPPPGRALAG